MLVINAQKCSVDGTCRHIPTHIEKLLQHNVDRDVAFEIASAESSIGSLASQYSVKFSSHGLFWAKIVNGDTPGWE